MTDDGVTDHAVAELPASVVLPITALASVLGVNLIINRSTTVVPLAVALTVIVGMSSALLVRAKRAAGGDTSRSVARVPLVTSTGRGRRRSRR